MSFATRPITAGVTQIVLPHPAAPLPYNIPNNVYLIEGAAPALVGAGHPHQQPALDGALASLGYARGDIARVVALDWTPDQLGGASTFPDAACFALSPDMIQPTSYGAIIDAERDRLRRWSAELEAHEVYASVLEFGQLDVAMDTWFGDLPRQLDVIPLRDGHRLVLGDRSFVVVKAGGPWWGHAVLRGVDGASPSMCFVGRLLQSTNYGEPFMQDISQAIVSIERIFDLEVDVALPTVGPPERDVRWTLKRINRRMTNLLSNLPNLLGTGSTIPDLVYRDLGYIPRHHVRFLHTLTLYHAYFDELIRTGVVFRDGDGVFAKYGTEANEERMSEL